MIRTITWTLLLLGLCSSAHAALVTYSFSGAGSSMFEHDGASGINTTVSNSSMFGFQLNDDDSFFGSFTYDTSAIESGYRDTNPDDHAAVFLSGLVEFEVSLAGYTYSSASPGSLVVWDNHGGTDAFSALSDEFVTPNTFVSSGFYLFDYTNQSQDGFSPPSNLATFNSFATKYFTIAFLDTDTGNQLHFDGYATSLSPVPLPASIWLFGSACLGLFLKEGRAPYRRIFGNLGKATR